MMLKSLLFVFLHLLLFSCQTFSIPLSNEHFVKRAGGLVPNPGGSGSTNQNGQTPAHPNVPSTGGVRHPNDGNRAPVERPPELPSTHPIGPPNLPRVQYEEDRRPSLLQRLTGNGDKKGKKRTQYEMANDREASSSGTNEPPNEQVKKCKKATAEDVRRMFDEIVEARNRQSQRRSHYQSPEERKYWRDFVGGGLAATATGVGLLANEGKKAYRKVKDACIGACRRVDQRIQRHFEQKGWTESSQPLRPGVQQPRSNQNVPGPGSWQYRQELAATLREKSNQRRRERARQTQVKRLGRSNSAPPNYQKPSKDKRLSRSRSLP